MTLAKTKTLYEQDFALWVEETVKQLKSGDFTQALVEAFQKNPELPVVKSKIPFNGRIIPAVRLSDHASFWDQGFKAVMITDTAFFRNPHYHRPSDTKEKLT